MTAKKLTFAKARRELRFMCMTIEAQAASRAGEYRVNFELPSSSNSNCGNLPNDGTEATAYYTTDLEDALETGIKMRQQRLKAVL